MNHHVQILKTTDAGQLRQGFVIVCLLLSLLLPAGQAQPPPLKKKAASQSEVMAALAFKIALHTEWPEKKEPLADSGLFIIGVASNPDDEAAFRVFEGKQLHGRRIKVIKIDAGMKVDDIRRCEMLFIGVKQNIEKHAKLAGIGQLLVSGGHPGAARKGNAAVEFSRKNNKLSFEFNTNTLRKHKVRVPESVLGYASKVHP